MKQSMTPTQTQREVTEFFACIAIIISSLTLIFIAAAIGG